MTHTKMALRSRDCSPPASGGAARRCAARLRRATARYARACGAPAARCARYARACGALRALPRA